MEKIKQITWIEQEKQIGVERYLSNDNSELLFCIAIQKFDNKYIIYKNEIDFTQPLGDLMDENDEELSYKVFDKLNKAIKYIDENTLFSLNELFPFKGSKMFNPKFAF